mgnify:FL=1
MKNIDLEYLCSVIAGLSGIPVRIFDGSSLIYYSFVGRLPRDPLEICKKEVFAIEKNIGYYMTAQFQYYGVVKHKKMRVVMGPTRLVTVSEAELRSLAFLADVPPDDTDDFVAGMKSIVPMPLESMMQTLCAVNYILNGERVSLADLTIYDELQTDLSSKMTSEKADAPAEYPADLHNTLSLEQALMSMIRKGDTAALSEWAKNAPPVRGGVIAFDQMRQLKNMFIVSVTLASRAAIRGGMDAEDALMLSDRYIQRCELMNTAEEITNLQFHMISDYTARVERLHFGNDPSQLIAAVSNYIQHHLSEPITTEQIASSLYISRTHLSARFHKETGITLSDYILKEKTEEAKRLLRYSDKSLAAISAYLGFSSQSHFSRTFRKYAGITPGEYRTKHAGH